jgi:cell division protein FtsL
MAAPATAPRKPAAAPRKSASRTPPSRKAAPATRSQRNARAIANARASQRAAAAPAARPTRPTRARPARPARRKSGAATKRSTATAPSPVARVLNSRGMPLLDRVLRGPAWVVMLGVLLAGIVFLNVSVLELNRGIARTDAKAADLERTNSALRARVAKLDSGERIQELASERGYVMPEPGQVTFLRGRSSDARLAAQRITPPADEATTTGTTTTTTTATTPTTTATPTTTTTPTTTATPTTTTTAAATVTPSSTETAPVAAEPTTQVP